MLLPAKPSAVSIREIVGGRMGNWTKEKEERSRVRLRIKNIIRVCVRGLAFLVDALPAPGQERLRVCRFGRAM
jgi:hypothetical protein